MVRSREKLVFPILVELCTAVDAQMAFPGKIITWKKQAFINLDL